MNIRDLYEKHTPDIDIEELAQQWMLHEQFNDPMPEVNPNEYETNDTHQTPVLVQAVGRQDVARSRSGRG